MRHESRKQIPSSETSSNIFLKGLLYVGATKFHQLLDSHSVMKWELQNSLTSKKLLEINGCHKSFLLKIG